MPPAQSTNEQFVILRDEIRERLLKYTRRAFYMLPSMEKPRILDIGCGSGIPTLELARLGQGNVVGIDIDKAALDKFAEKIKEAGLTDRVRVLNCSISDMNFPDGSFDILWSEGSIYVVGFKRGLSEWQRLLAPGGYMVIHDEQGNVQQKLRLISDCGYELIGHFLLSQDIWREEYFAPLQELVDKFQNKLIDDPKAVEGLHRAQEELSMFRKNPERNSSAYFIIKRQ